MKQDKEWYIGRAVVDLNSLLKTNVETPVTYGFVDNRHKVLCTPTIDSVARAYLVEFADDGAWCSTTRLF
ncbi:MAG: hypothetical protein FWD76_03185 [Firmicutes bacterium]|nr:hypothetical protein [Bacillota bacterium]